MHELYELKSMLMQELEEYGKKGEMSAGSLEIVDKLAHAIKNLCKIMEMDDGGSYAYADGSYEGGSYGRSRRGGSGNRSYAYARGRGRNARRDSMGRYSSEGYSREGYSMAAEDMVEQLQELMQDAPDEKIKQDIQRLITKVEQMQ